MRTPPDPPIGRGAATPATSRAGRFASAARGVRRGGLAITGALIAVELIRIGSWWVAAAVAGAVVLTLGLLPIARRLLPDKAAARLLAQARDAGQLDGAIDAAVVAVWPPRAAAAVNAKLLRQIYRAVVIVHPDRLVVWPGPDGRRKGRSDTTLRLSEVEEAVFDLAPVPGAGARVFLGLAGGGIHHFVARDPDRLAAALRAAAVPVSGLG